MHHSENERRLFFVIKELADVAGSPSCGTAMVGAADPDHEKLFEVIREKAAEIEDLRRLVGQLVEDRVVPDHLRARVEACLEKPVAESDADVDALLDDIAQRSGREVTDHVATIVANPREVSETVGTPDPIPVPGVLLHAVPSEAHQSTRHPTPYNEATEVPF